ncbi:hypothetical protein SNEBB_004257 [Seison nebaliae]|nr:hypothetical protein SNEBB_004257 [Seison nebaliae]
MNIQQTDPYVCFGGAISLGNLLDLAVHKTYDEITRMADTIANEKPMQKKIKIIEFACETRQMFARLRAILKWLKNDYNKFKRCAAILKHIDETNRLFDDTMGQMVEFTQQVLNDVRLPPFCVGESADILIRQNYVHVPPAIAGYDIRQEIEFFHPKYNDENNEKNHQFYLSHLKQLMNYRLVHEDYPLSYENIRINDDSVEMTIPDDFIVNLTLNNSDVCSPWQLLSIEPLIRTRTPRTGLSINVYEMTENEQLEIINIHPDQLYFLKDSLQRLLNIHKENGLKMIYEKLHKFSQLIRLDMMIDHAYHFQQLRESFPSFATNFISKLQKQSINISRFINSINTVNIIQINKKEINPDQFSIIYWLTLGFLCKTEFKITIKITNVSEDIARNRKKFLLIHQPPMPIYYRKKINKKLENRNFFYNFSVETLLFVTWKERILILLEDVKELITQSIPPSQIHMRIVEGEEGEQPLIMVEVKDDELSERILYEMTIIGILESGYIGIFLTNEKLNNWSNEILMKLEDELNYGRGKGKILNIFNELKFEYIKLFLEDILHKYEMAIPTKVQKTIPFTLEDDTTRRYVQSMKNEHGKFYKKIFVEMMRTGNNYIVVYCDNDGHFHFQHLITSSCNYECKSGPRPPQKREGNNTTPNNRNNPIPNQRSTQMGVYLENFKKVEQVYEISNNCSPLIMSYILPKLEAQFTNYLLRFQFGSQLMDKRELSQRNYSIKITNSQIEKYENYLKTNKFQQQLRQLIKLFLSRQSVQSTLNKIPMLCWLFTEHVTVNNEVVETIQKFGVHARGLSYYPMMQKPTCLVTSIPSVTCDFPMAYYEELVKKFMYASIYHGLAHRPGEKDKVRFWEFNLVLTNLPYRNLSEFIAKLPNHFSDEQFSGNFPLENKEKIIISHQESWLNRYNRQPIGVRVIQTLFKKWRFVVQLFVTFKELEISLREVELLNRRCFIGSFDYKTLNIFVMDYSGKELNSILSITHFENKLVIRINRINISHPISMTQFVRTCNTFQTLYSSKLRHKLKNIRWILIHYLLSMETAITSANLTSSIKKFTVLKKSPKEMQRVIVYYSNSHLTNQLNGVSLKINFIPRTVGFNVDPTDFGMSRKMNIDKLDEFFKTFNIDFINHCTSHSIFIEFFHYHFVFIYDQYDMGKYTTSRLTPIIYLRSFLSHFIRYIEINNVIPHSPINKLLPEHMMHLREDFQIGFDSLKLLKIEFPITYFEIQLLTTSCNDPIDENFTNSFYDPKNLIELSKDPIHLTPLTRFLHCHSLFISLMQQIRNASNSIMITDFNIIPNADNQSLFISFNSPKLYLQFNFKFDYFTNPFETVIQLKIDQYNPRCQYPQFSLEIFEQYFNKRIIVVPYDHMIMDGFINIILFCEKPKIFIDLSLVMAMDMYPDPTKFYRIEICWTIPPMLNNWNSKLATGVTLIQLFDDKSLQFLILFHQQFPALELNEIGNYLDYSELVNSLLKKHENMLMSHLPSFGKEENRRNLLRTNYQFHLMFRYMTTTETVQFLQFNNEFERLGDELNCYINKEFRDTYPFYSVLKRFIDELPRKNC